MNLLNKKYKPINGWTKKEILSVIETDFKGKSVDSAGASWYRGPKGRKCPVGLFIPDELYEREMELWAIGTDESTDGLLIYCYPEIYNFLPLELEAMDQMQLVHDYSKKSKTKKWLLNWVNLNVEDEL